MRDFSSDHSALALNAATLGHNVEGAGAGWSPERVIDACAERGYGGIVFWRRGLRGRAAAIGDRARAAGLEVIGLLPVAILVDRFQPRRARRGTTSTPPSTTPRRRRPAV